jgi:hypothetical protein
MATNFKSFPQHVPTDQQPVWFRRFNVVNDGEPGLWDEPSSCFVSTELPVPVPWYFVVQWKNRNPS